MNGWRKLKSSNVIRSILGIGGAAGLGQLMAFAASPILTRIYSPEAFGQFGLLFGLVNVFAAVALFGLHDALFVPAREYEARALFFAGGLSILLLSPAAGCVAYILIVYDFFGLGALPYWSAPLAVADIAAIAATMLLQQWLVRGKRFRDLASTHLILGGVRSGGQIGFGFFGSGFLWLMLAEILTRLAVAAYVSTRIRDDLLAIWQTGIQSALQTAWRHRHFPMLRMPSMVVNNIGAMLPLSLVTMAYDVTAAGLYALMYTVISAPIGLIQKAVGDVFLGNFYGKLRIDRASAEHFLFKIVSALFLCSLIPGLIIFFWGGELLAVIFGEEWRQAGVLASITAPLFIAAFSISPVSTALNVVNRPGGALIYDAARIIGFMFAYWIATARDAPMESMVGLFAGFGVIAYLIYAALIIYGVRNPRMVIESQERREHI